MNSRRVATGASTGCGRQTRTMLEARALVPMEITRPFRSVLTGQVPLIPNWALIIASRNVSQPVLVVLDYLWSLTV